MLPEVPYLGLDMEPCSIVGSRLFPGRLKSRKDKDGFELETLFDATRISTYECLNQYEMPGDATPVALDGQGEVVGYTRAVGAGKATILGTHLKFVFNVHPALFPKFLSANGIVRHCYAEDSRIHMCQRSTESYSYVTALNLYETPISTQLIVTDPRTNTHVKISERTPVTIPGRSGLILGLNLPLPDGTGELLYSTSQVAAVNGDGKEITIYLQGARGTRGEGVVKLSRKPDAVYINGRAANDRARWNQSMETMAVAYVHRSKRVEVRIVF